MTDAFSSLVDFEVISFAKNILSEIESFRSLTVGKSDSDGEISQTPNESRLNTFYRLIGFPMFVSLKAKNGETLDSELTNVNHLTPGFVAYCDNSTHPLITGNISVEDSSEVTYLTVTTPSGANTKLKSELQRREEILINLESSIGTKLTNNRMIVAFYKPMGIMMVDKNSSNMTGTELKETDIIKNRFRYKKLTPFVTMAGSRGLNPTQPLWDIYPKRNTLSKPFVVNPSLQKIDSQTTLKRPFIETVIRIRLLNKDALTSQYYIDTKNNLSKQGISLPNSGTLMEAFIINKLFLSLKQLAKKWIYLNTKQQEIIKDNIIQFAPTTGYSKSDPLGKMSFKTPNITAQAGTVNGAKLLKIKQNIAELEAMASLLPTDDQQVTKDADKSYTFITNVSANALTNPFLSILNSDLTYHREQLAKVEKEIQDATTQADKIRYELEMMTGEFMGLSICDIICIIIGLFIVDIDFLLGLLDPYVKSDMNLDPVLKSALEFASTINASPGESLMKLEDAVKSVYNQLYKEIEAFSDKSKRTKNTDTKNSVTKTKISNNYASKHRSVDDILRGGILT